MKKKVRLSARSSFSETGTRKEKKGKNNKEVIGTERRPDRFFYPATRERKKRGERVLPRNVKSRDGSACLGFEGLYYEREKKKEGRAGQGFNSGRKRRTVRPFSSSHLGIGIRGKKKRGGKRTHVQVGTKKRRKRGPTVAHTHLFLFNLYFVKKKR